MLLEVKTGKSAGKKVVLRPAIAIKVGRSEEATVVIRDDPRMADLHFALEWNGETFRLRDLRSGPGTLLNGVRVSEAAVQEGDEIMAGRTLFFILRPEAAPVAPLAPPRALLEILRTLPEPLFALLDAARDRRVLALLAGSGEEYQSLYEGPQGDELAEAAPYLLRLPAGTPFLEILVRAGWGKSWGVYLTCGQSFKEVRKHFRHFLLVKAEDGREMYFRFYDPRVLRLYLPTCKAEETAEFFGPVTRFLMEGARSEALLQFTPGGSEVFRAVLPLPAGANATGTSVR